MRTRKALKITGLVQLLSCVLMLGSMAISLIVARHSIPIPRDSALFRLLDVYGGLAAILWLIPTAVVCFFVNLTAYTKERKDPEQRKCLGRAWLWIPIAFIAVLAVKYLFLHYLAVTILLPELFPV